VTAAGRRRVLGAVVVVQTLCELVYVGGRSELTVGLRVFLMIVLALQVVFAQGVLRRSAGSVFALFAYEAMAVVAAFAAHGPVLARAALAVAAVAVIVLLLASLSDFPSATLPRSTSRT